MVQVLPAVPTFGEQLIPVLAQAGANIGEGLRARRAKMEWEKFVNPSQQQQANAQNQNVPGVSQQQPQMQQPVSPLQQILNKPGGPTLQDTIAISDMAQKAGINPKVVENYLSNEQKFNQKRQLATEASELANKNAQINKRTEATTGTLESINKQRRDLLSARAAVQSGDVGAFSRNSLAELFGPVGERFKNASGARLDAATKALLVDSLGDVSAKGTNLWLEKVAKSAIAGLGKTEESNETLITIALGELDIKEKKLGVEQELLTQYDQLGIKPPPNFDKIVDDLVKPYAKKIENQVSYDTRVLYEKEKGTRFLNNLEPVPKDTPLTREKRDALVKKVMLENDSRPASKNLTARPVSEATAQEREKAKKLALKLGYKIPESNPTQQTQEPLNVQ